MRQRYLIITAMAAMMVSCANNDTFKASVQADNENKPLSFAAYADKVTKSGNSTALNDFYSVFSVYGWKAVQKEDGSDTEYKPVFQNIPNEYFTVDDNGAVVYKTTGKPSRTEFENNTQDYYIAVTTIDGDDMDESLESIKKNVLAVVYVD